LNEMLLCTTSDNTHDRLLDGLLFLPQVFREFASLVLKVTFLIQNHVLVFASERHFNVSCVEPKQSATWAASEDMIVLGLLNADRDTRGDGKKWGVGLQGY
jgi:hypothetical protein